MHLLDSYSQGFLTCAALLLFYKVMRAYEEHHKQTEEEKRWQEAHKNDWPYDEMGN